MRMAQTDLSRPRRSVSPTWRGAVAAFDHQAGDPVLLAERAEPLGDVVADEALEDQDEVDPVVADPLLEESSIAGLASS